MAISRQLFPNDEIVSSWTSIRDVCAFLGLRAEAWRVVATELGEEDFSSTALLAAVEVVYIRQAVERARIGDAVLGIMDRTRVALVYNGVRLRHGLELVSLAAPAAAGAGPAPAPAPHLDAGLKIRISTVLDQASDAEVASLSGDELANLRRRYVVVRGDHPVPRMDVTDTQLSAFQRWVTSGRCPATDFGVWGPHGARIERRLKFTNHVLDVGGRWRTAELSGPDCFDTWLECWHIFETACIMCETATAATLDKYREEFRSLVDRFPTAWHICVRAEWRCRSEYWTQELHQQQSFHKSNPELSAYQPDMELGHSGSGS